MEKVLKFLIFFLSIIGLISGIGYSLYIGEYITAIGVSALGYCGSFKLIEIFNELQS